MRYDVVEEEDAQFAVGSEVLPLDEPVLIRFRQRGYFPPLGPLIPRIPGLEVLMTRDLELADRWVKERKVRRTEWIGYMVHQRVFDLKRGALLAYLPQHDPSAGVSLQRGFLSSPVAGTDVEMTRPEENGREERKQAVRNAAADEELWMRLDAYDDFDHEADFEARLAGQEVSETAATGSHPSTPLGDLWPLDDDAVEDSLEDEGASYDEGDAEEQRAAHDPYFNGGGGMANDSGVTVWDEYDEEKPVSAAAADPLGHRPCIPSACFVRSVFCCRGFRLLPLGDRRPAVESPRRSIAARPKVHLLQGRQCGDRRQTAAAVQRLRASTTSSTQGLHKGSDPCLLLEGGRRSAGR